MSWLGAGIGAGIGMVIGGPIGAGIGAWLGHSVGNAKAVMAGQKEAQTVFFVSLFSMLAKMAKADGKVSPEEADLINHIAKTQMNMDAEDRKAAREIFNNALNDDYSIYDYAKQYKQVMRNQQMLEMVYRLLFAVALADQKLHHEEELILKEIPSHLGLDSSIYKQHNYGEPEITAAGNGQIKMCQHILLQSEGFELALLIHSSNRRSNHEDATVHAVMPWATVVTALQCETPGFGR